MNSRMVKIFQGGYADNGAYITYDALKYAIDEGLFENIPVIRWNEDKLDYGVEDSAVDEAIGVVISVDEYFEPDVYGEVIFFEDNKLKYNFKNYEITLEDSDFINNELVIHKFIPVAVYIE
jgi:hypothetical protein